MSGLHLRQIHRQVVGEPPVPGPEGLGLRRLGVPHDAETVLVGVEGHYAVIAYPELLPAAGVVDIVKGGGEKRAPPGTAARRHPGPTPDPAERPSLGNGKSGPAGISSSIPGGGGSSPPSAGMAPERGAGRSRERDRPWVILPFHSPYPCRTPEELQFHTVRYAAQASMS